MLNEFPHRPYRDGDHPQADPSAQRDSFGHLAVRHGAALAALCADELHERHPRLQAAGKAGDLNTLKIEAHALRGVAANFGLTVLAEQLLALEAAARSGDRNRIAEVLGRMPAEVAQALVALGQANA
jgi:HPt (histidine-containing phosphotransfer) domain-containing protein